MSDTSIPLSKRAPWRSVKNSQGKGCAAIERAFAQGRWHEIEVWDRQGVIEQAMSGTLKTRRDYRKSLFSLLLKHSNERTWQDDILRKREQEMLGRLWEMGAKEQTDLFETWLLIACDSPIADRLLGLGVNPHAEIYHKNQKKSATHNMLQQVLKHKRELEAGLGSQDWPSSREQLKARITLCLNTPGATQEQLDEYLQITWQRALFATPEELPLFETWRDLLLAQGARPTFSSPGLFTALQSARDPERIDEWYWHLLTSRREKATGNKFSDEEKANYIQAFVQREQTHWKQVANRWLEVFLPYTDMGQANAQDSIFRQEQFWRQLLAFPVGIELGAKLLDAGVIAPWNEPENKGSCADLFVDWRQRKVNMLKNFLALTRDRPVDALWRQEAGSRYLKEDSYSGRAHSQVLAPHEVDMVLELVRWTPNAPLQPAFVSWISSFSSQCKRTNAPEGTCEEMIEHLGQRGVLTGLFENDEYAGQQVAGRWASEQAYWPLVLQASTHAPKAKIAAGFACLGVNAKDTRDYWIGQALSVDSSLASIMLEKAMAISGSNWAGIPILLGVVESLNHNGHTLTPDKETELAVHISQSLGGHGAPDAQRTRVERMQQAKLDFNAGNGVLINGIIQAEQALSEQTPNRMEGLMPFVEAAMEAGMDPRLISTPMPDPYRPLSLRLGQEMQQRLMHDHAPQAPARPRIRL